MIELMLEAERAMAVGLLDKAERYYNQVVAADPNNSIAVVGLARVALERGDERGAYLHARRALTMDPDNPMASHLVMRMGELIRNRGETVPEAPVAGPTPRGPAAAAQPEASEPLSPAAPTAGTPESPARPAESPALPARSGLVGRILRRRR